jgi:subtilisin family serine protease
LRRGPAIKVGFIIAITVSFIALTPTQIMAFRSTTAWIDHELVAGANSVLNTEQEKLPVTIVSYSTLTQTQLQQVASIGVLGTTIDDIATVRLPKESIVELAKLRFVKRVESGYATPALDISVPEIGATEAWHNSSATGNPLPRGAGVIVGIVDTGIDWRHKDFKFENGSSKLLFLWDQTRSGIPPHELAYGTEWTRSQIEAGLCDSKDQTGHGTHVAGIASGTGRSIGKYTGVAPDSSLIIVKSGMMTRKGWRFRWPEVIDGVNYIWQKAKALGKRAVVNLSLGSNSGGHDGMSSIERVLDRLVSEGVVVVVSAGNEGTRGAHAQGRLARDETVTLTAVPTVDEDEIYLEIWYSTSDEMNISLKCPDGQIVNGSTSSSGFSTPRGTIHIGHDSSGKGKAWRIMVVSPTNMTEDQWTISLQGNSILDRAEWDAWLSTKGKFLPGFGYEVTANKTVTVPGTAQNVITVGAYVTRTQWTTKNGTNYQDKASEALGDLARFSSRGPTRDGRLKPELCAPGKVIVSAKPIDTVGSETNPTELHSVKQGTSMAAPHITGVAAIMMECNPDLTASAVKEIMKMTARQDIYTSETAPDSSYKWGFGKPNAKKAVSICKAKYEVRLVFVGVPVSFSPTIVVDGLSGSIANAQKTTTLELNAGTTLVIMIEPIILGKRSQMTVFHRTVPKYVFNRWTVQQNGTYSLTPTSQALTLLIDGPKTVVGEWREEIGIELDILAVGSVLFASAVLLTAAILLLIVRGKDVHLVTANQSRNRQIDFTRHHADMIKMVLHETVLSDGSNSYLQRRYQQSEAQRRRA